MLCLGYAETQTARIGTMPHQIDTAPQIESAGEPGRGWARPASAGAPAGWPALDPSLLEDGRPVVPAFPLDTLPQPWREWVSDTAVRRRRPGRLRGASRAGRGRRPVRGRREGLRDAVMVGAAGPVAGAGRRAVGRQDAGPRRDRPPARQRREAAAAGQRRRGQPRASRGRPCARRKARRARGRSRRADTIRCRPSARRVAVAR